MITWGQFNSLRGSRYGPLGLTSAWFRRALGGYTPQEGADEDEDNKCIHTLHKGEDGSTGIDGASFAAQCYYMYREKTNNYIDILLLIKFGRQIIL